MRGWWWVVALCAACGGSDPGPMPALLQPPAPLVLSPDDQCRPGSNATHWGLEGDPFEVEVACSLPLQLDPSAFELPELPPGASWNPGSGRLLWRPSLDQAGIWHVPVLVPSLGERGYLHLGVVERWGADGNVAIRHPEGYAEEYGLPVVHLSIDGGLSEAYAPATLTYRGRRYPIELKYRGNTSLAYPKQSFTVKLDKDDPLVEPHFAGGFVRRKFVLTSNFDDASYIRQRLVYDLWNELDPEHVPVKTFSAVVYLKGHPWGLYTLGDHIDKHLLEPNGIAKSANIYKAVRAHSDFRMELRDGRPKHYLAYGIDKKEGWPKPGEPGAFEDLEKFITTVARAPDDELRAWLTRHVRLEDYVDWWALAVFGLTTDSVHKNVYFIHDPIRGPWRCVPWDFNASFGQDHAVNRLGATMDTEFGVENELFRRLLNDPSFGARARLGEALDGPLSLERVNARIDTYVEETAAGARRDWARWGASHRAYFGQPNADYDAEIAYLRTWVEQRWHVLRARYPTPTR